MGVRLLLVSRPALEFGSVRIRNRVTATARGWFSDKVNVSVDFQDSVRTVVWVWVWVELLLGLLHRVRVCVWFHNCENRRTTHVISGVQVRFGSNQPFETVVLAPRCRNICWSLSVLKSEEDVDMGMSANRGWSIRRTNWYTDD